jgi:hypothetical protein
MKPVRDLDSVRGRLPDGVAAERSSDLPDAFAGRRTTAGDRAELYSTRGSGLYISPLQYLEKAMRRRLNEAPEGRIVGRTAT